MRISNLDYLRGLAAFGIMIYHFSGWLLGTHSYNTFLGRFGVYGVSIFYCLSGLTLFYVYFGKLNSNFQEILTFFKKRFFRIYPLLILVTVVSVIISKNTPKLIDIVLNLTGLFGFIKWNAPIAGGVWSIGNELVYYCIFPLLIITNNRFKVIFLILILLSFFFHFYFSFKIFNQPLSTYEEIRNYFNPLNNLFFFTSGYLIGLLFKDSTPSKYLLSTVFIASLLVFIFIPSGDKRIDILNGFNRIVLSFCCISITLFFYKSYFNLPSQIDKILLFLGEISYSLYLIHPIVIRVFKILKLNTILPNEFVFLVGVLTSLILSYFSYNYFEKFFLKFSKKELTSNKS